MKTPNNSGSDAPLEKIRKSHPKLHTEIADSQMKGMEYANSRIAQVKLMGKVRYIDRCDRQLVFYNKEDMATILAHESVLIVGWELHDGKRVPVAKAVPLFRWWCCQHDRRQYSETVFLPFRPGGKAVGLPDGALNTFPGFATPSAFAGPFDLFREHVETNLAGGDPVLSEWMFDFMADIVQNPTRRVPVMLILRGGKGTGKSTFSNVLAKLLGEDLCPVIDSEQGLTGRFAGAMFERAMLLVVEEAYWAGSVASESRLKSLVTSPRLPVEHKGVATYMAPAYFRIVMTANADHVVPSGPGERRFVVADVADHRKGDSTFFKDMWAQLEAGGLKTLMAHLMARPLKDRDWSKPPKTAALADQVRFSLKSDERWWSSILTTGVVPYDRLPDGASTDADAEWSLDAAFTIERAHLLASYQQNCKAFGGSLSPESLGRFLRKVVGDDLGFRKATFHMRGRVNCYCLPTRREAMASFMRAHAGLLLTPEAEADDLDATAGGGALDAEAGASVADVYNLASRRSANEAGRPI